MKNRTEEIRNLAEAINHLCCAQKAQYTTGLSYEIEMLVQTITKLRERFEAGE